MNRFRNVASSIGAARQAHLTRTVMGKNLPRPPKASWEGLDRGFSTYVNMNKSGYYNPANWKAKALKASRQQSMRNNLDMSFKHASLRSGKPALKTTEHTYGRTSGSVQTMSRLRSLDRIR